MGLINSANSVFKWNGTWGEAIRAAGIGCPFSRAFRGHLYAKKWYITALLELTEELL